MVIKRWKMNIMKEDKNEWLWPPRSLCIDNSSTHSPRILSLLFLFWGPDLVDPLAAHLKWPGWRERTLLPGFVLPRVQWGWAPCIWRRGSQIMTCRGFGDLWSLRLISQRQPYPTSPSSLWGPAHPVTPQKSPEEKPDKTQGGEGMESKKNVHLTQIVNLNLCAVQLCFSVSIHWVLFYTLSEMLQFHPV